MDPALRIRLNLGLNLIALSFCIVGFVLENWGNGDPPEQYKDTPISKTAIKDLDYDKYSNIGILRSCVFDTCISNMADGSSVWKVLGSLGTVSLVCFILSTGFNALQTSSDLGWIKYAIVASQMIGVVLYTVMIVVFYLSTTGTTLAVGFFIALIADALALCSGIVTFTSVIKTNNRVEALT